METPIKFVIGSPDGELTTLHEEKSRDSPEAALLGDGDKVIAIPKNENNDPEWQFVRFDRDMGNTPPIEGWVETRNLKERTADPGPRLPLEIAPFVRSCARVELIANAAGGENQSTIVADYLLAWANIESAGETANYTNPGPDPAHSDAEGPFRLTPAEWKAYMDSVNKPVPYISEFEYSLPTCQVAGAAFTVLQQLDDFTELVTPEAAQPPDGPFIPSYINALHCRLIGVPSAFHFNDIFKAGGGGVSVDDALAKNIPDQPSRKRIMESRKDFFLDNGKPVSVERFFLRTSEALSKSFKNAYRDILEHASYLLPPAQTLSAGAPWMEIAEGEHEIWQTKNLNEASGEGLEKVVTYFKSVNPAIKTNKPWCGAFVGHCLATVEPSLASTIVKDGGLASSWKNWGNARLRGHQLREIPVGAVVVTAPMSEGTTGHVGFFLEKVDGEESVRLLGGNQSNTVSKTFKVKKNDIREIRWLDNADPTPDATSKKTPVAGSPVGANDGDVLTLARTLYGEARGEDRKGIEAVANVIINRVRVRFMGSDTVTEVCRKPFQFSCWNRSDPNFKVISGMKPGDDTKFDVCFDIAGKAVRGAIPNHVGNDTLHYHATYIRAPSWVRKSPGAKVTLRHGGHIFYSGIK